MSSSMPLNLRNSPNVRGNTSIKLILPARLSDASRYSRVLDDPDVSRYPF